jgi:hypothetical protein
MPTKFPNPSNPAEVYDQLEKEQEAIVNKVCFLIDSVLA